MGPVVFAVLGAGNAGRAIAGYLAFRGCRVRLWNRSLAKVQDLLGSGYGEISLTGALSGTGRLECVTDDLERAVGGADVIMVATPATAHRELGTRCAPHLTDGQVVVLNPGRTGGALEFRKAVVDGGGPSGVTVAECQSLVFACRTVGPGLTRVHAVKRKVELAALPAREAPRVVRMLKPFFRSVVASPSVLHTGLANFGAVLHPAAAVLNACRLDGSERFGFYEDGMTPSVVRVIEAIDHERLNLARLLSVKTLSLREWLRRAYGLPWMDLRTCLTHNRGYRGIPAPDGVSTRYISEDVPTGLVPMASLGDVLSYEATTMRAIIRLASIMHGVDYWAVGRKAADLGIAGDGDGANGVLRIAWGVS